MGEWDDEFAIFGSKYVPNAEAAEAHRKWVRSNPGEAARWATLRNAVLAGSRSAPLPSMATPHGKALVAVAEMQMSVSRLVGSVVPPTPPIPPGPPPTPPQTRRFQRKTDFEGFFNLWQPTGFYGPSGSGTPWANGSGCFEIATPGGNGLRFVCNAGTDSPWEAASKIVQGGLFDEAETAAWIGQRQLWTWQMRFPSALNNGFNFGFWGHHILMEWGTTGGSVGHEFTINTNGTCSFYVREGPGQFPTRKYSTAAPVPLDTWIPVSWDVKHSYGADGLMIGKIGGVEVMNRTGPNMWNGEVVRHMGIGWYGVDQNSNCVEFDSMGYALV